MLQIDLSEAGMQGLAAEARQAALAGFAGKQVIHPKQVSIAGLLAARFRVQYLKYRAAVHTSTDSHGKPQIRLP